MENITRRDAIKGLAALVASLTIAGCTGKNDDYSYDYKDRIAEYKKMETTTKNLEDSTNNIIKANYKLVESDNYLTELIKARDSFELATKNCSTILSNKIVSSRYRETPDGVKYFTDLANKLGYRINGTDDNAIKDLTAKIQLRNGLCMDRIPGIQTSYALRSEANKKIIELIQQKIKG